MKKIIVLLTAIALVMSAPTQAQNKLTAAETKAGWKLLFDGTSTKGWKVFNGKSDGTAWKVADGALYLDASTKEGRGDLITAGEYENYEFSYDWKIAANGNSGLLFN